MPNILDEYLVQLGATVDAAGFSRFHQALREAKSATDATAKGMAGALFKAQVEIVSGFAAIGGAALGLVDKVAMADQEYRLFALHMFMSKDAARGLKVAMDALGQPLENLWWDPELAQRTHQLIQDQKRMAPDGDFEGQMRKIRDIRFEFTRMEVELKYLGMHVVQDFMKALGMGPDDLLKRLRKFNEWVIKDLPGISQRLVNDFMPIWQDLKEVVSATAEALQNAGLLFTNLVGLFTGDTSIEGTTFNLDDLATATHHVASGFAEFATLLAHTELMLAHFANALTLLASGKFKEAGAELKAGGDSITTKEGMEMLTGAFGGVFGGPAGLFAGGMAAHEFGIALENTIGDKVMPATQASAIGRGLPLQDIMNALIWQESRGNPSLVSPKGAMGLTQLMPETARAYGVTNPFDPKQSYQGGQHVLTDLLQHYQGNLAYALAGYNWGSGNLDKFLSGKATRMPMETQNYVSSILGRLGKRGDVQIGSVVIHIKEPNATPQQIHRTVTSAMRDAVGNEAQRNMSEFQDMAWSY